MNWTEALRALFGAFGGAFGFLCLMRAPKKAWIPASGVAGLSYLVFWLLQLRIAEPLAVFFSTFLGSLMCHFLSRRMRMINTIFLMAAIVPVVPGLGLYRMMAELGRGNTAAGANLGVNAMIIIAMTAVGLALGTFVDRLIHRHPHGNRPPNSSLTVR